MYDSPPLEDERQAFALPPAHAVIPSDPPFHKAMAVRTVVLFSVVWLALQTNIRIAYRDVISRLRV